MLKYLEELCLLDGTSGREVGITADNIDVESSSSGTYNKVSGTDRCAVGTSAA